MLYDIWIEGYLVTGMEGIPSTAVCKGSFPGDSFKDACDNCFGSDRYYDSMSLTYWGCRLFDNELDARKSFG